MQPNLDELGNGLAAVGLAPMSGPGRSFVAREQGDAIILLSAARRLRVTARAVFGLPRLELRRPTRGVTLSLSPLAALEEAVSKEVGALVSIAGLRLGAGGASKLAVGFVDQNRLVAIAKFPIAERAVESLAHEVETINRLNGFDRLSRHMPDVISDLGLGTTQGTLFSAGPIGRVRRPGENVVAFLSTLHELTARESTMQTSGLVDSWLARLDTQRSLLGSARSSTIEDAIRLVNDVIGQVSIDHTIAHGDFTRWNIRQGPSGLFVFDWEASVWPALPYHDLFHYLAAESALLHRPSPLSRFNRRRISAIAELVSPTCTHLQPALYAAYLVHTALWYAEIRDWNTGTRPGRFWRFLWSELSEATKATRFKNR